jgi:hypothetical protein
MEDETDCSNGRSKTVAMDGEELIPLLACYTSNAISPALNWFIIRSRLQECIESWFSQEGRRGQSANLQIVLVTTTST